MGKGSDRYGKGVQPKGIQPLWERDPTVGEKGPDKRWAVLTSKRGRTFYHNTETGEDRWDKPVDLEADVAEDAFVPFKNDAVKKAVLREQMKLEATKMGVPVEVVAATQHRLQHEDKAGDPFANMMVREDKTGKKSTPIRADNPDQRRNFGPAQLYITE
ncbi:unnamed protein product [Peronospora farinosa]|uniref:WW domain-containing protein n=1 Tax=Peronospora farinosa TaxID=134698 RepID=A0AAV0SSY5_9STRA|nr:unnamed protein product [Peronospora farinosa]